MTINVLSFRTESTNGELVVVWWLRYCRQGLDWRRPESLKAALPSISCASPQPSLLHRRKRSHSVQCAAPSLTHPQHLLLCSSLQGSGWVESAARVTFFLIPTEHWASPRQIWASSSQHRMNRILTQHWARPHQIWASSSQHWASPGQHWKSCRQIWASSSERLRKS